MLLVGHNNMKTNYNTNQYWIILYDYHGSVKKIFTRISVAVSLRALIKLIAHANLHGGLLLWIQFS